MTLFKKTANRYFAFGRQPVPNVTGIKGKIVAISEPRQAQTYVPEHLRKAGVKPEPAFWDKEKTRAIEEIVIDLQTDLNEPSEDGTADDGLRKLVVKVDRKQGGKMAAIQDAIFSTGAEDIEVGAFLALWFTGTDPQSANPDNPRKLFQANYQRPPAGGGAFQQQQEQVQPPAQQQQQQQQPPAQQQQQPPAQQQQQPGANFGAQQGQGQGQVYPPAQQRQEVQVDVATVGRMISEGLTDSDIMQATGASLEVVSALRNLQQQPTIY